MKVILMQKVERLGDPGQQVDVAEGYARNFLLPRKLAVEATAGHLRSLAQLTAQAKNREDRARHEAAALAERLRDVEVVFRRRASEDAPVLASPAATAAPAEAGAEPPAPAEPSATEAPAPAEKGARLFGSVTNHDLSEALAAHGIAIDKKKILLDEPIKTLGRHRVAVRLHAEVSADFGVVVEREA
jgi:large subunit ribosomal protein L9